MPIRGSGGTPPGKFWNLRCSERHSKAFLWMKIGTETTLTPHTPSYLQFSSDLDVSEKWSRKPLGGGGGRPLAPPCLRHWYRSIIITIRKRIFQKFSGLWNITELWWNCVHGARITVDFSFHVARSRQITNHVRSKSAFTVHAGSSNHGARIKFLANHVARKAEFAKSRCTK